MRYNELLGFLRSMHCSSSSKRVLSRGKKAKKLFFSLRFFYSLLYRLADCESRRSSIFDFSSYSIPIVTLSHSGRTGITPKRSQKRLRSGGVKKRFSAPKWQKNINFGQHVTEQWHWIFEFFNSLSSKNSGVESYIFLQLFSDEINSKREVT